ncbi:MAG: hypothetical protein NTY66_01305 [Candidatus Vogelbacteria bacterium]|nr:hypothetical protein [Candidatus Vogelbacteria bacterium]
MDCVKCTKPIKEGSACQCNPTVCAACCDCGEDCEGCDCSSTEKQNEVVDDD